MFLFSLLFSSSLHFNRSLRMLGFSWIYQLFYYAFLTGIGELKILHLCTFGSSFVYQERRRNRSFFSSMIPEYGVCGHFTICSLYPLERFGKMLFSCRVTAETERHEPAWARLMVFGLRHMQQRSGLDVMQCTRLPVERETASWPCKLARRYASSTQLQSHAL